MSKANLGRWRFTRTDLEAQGWRIETPDNKHFNCYPPDKSQGVVRVCPASTGQRVWSNFQACLKRAGYVEGELVPNSSSTLGPSAAMLLGEQAVDEGISTDSWNDRFFGTWWKVMTREDPRDPRKLVSVKDNGDIVFKASSVIPGRGQVSARVNFYMPIDVFIKALKRGEIAELSEEEAQALIKEKEAQRARQDDEEAVQEALAVPEPAESGDRPQHVGMEGMNILAEHYNTSRFIFTLAQEEPEKAWRIEIIEEPDRSAITIGKGGTAEDAVKNALIRVQSNLHVQERRLRQQRERVEELLA